MTFFPPQGEKPVPGVTYCDICGGVMHAAKDADPRPLPIEFCDCER